MSETTENVETTTDGTEEHRAPEYALLRVWLELLSNVENVRDQPIPLVVAHKIVNAWPKLSYQDTAKYHQLYHGLLVEVRNILKEVVDEHPGCLDFEGEDDARENHGIYHELVIAWNVLLDQYELEWRAEAEDSHITLAAMVDVRAFLFSRTGFAGYMEHRGITFDTDEIAEAIAAAREEQGE